jgi:gamma-glutamyl:cysteine ligase YbdK (ATP-grasp superfamily)
MLVSADTLDVLPKTDELLRGVAGEYVGEVKCGAVSWSNELVLHVVELKASSPAESLSGLAQHFQEHVGKINARLAGLGGKLMPSAMHPWMDPLRETHLWPHEHDQIYHAYDRIFDCHTHGWANLQSAHLNLPFNGDDEFGRLHAAIRMVLPLLPALAASSPIISGKPASTLDTRLDVYRTNSRKIPEISGRVIPEPVFTMQEYHERILAPMYAAIAPLDQDGVLQHEFLNSRGAIARFVRNTIETRLLDVQECPRADLAILTLVAETIRGLVEERFAPYQQQRQWEVAPLDAILQSAVRDADAAMIEDAEYLRQLGWQGEVPCTAGAVWRHLAARVLPDWAKAEFADVYRTIFERGVLSRRILAAVGENPTKAKLKEVYGGLCDGLAAGRLLAP